MEAAHIAWRPLGRLLVEQGLLTGEELELALAKQQQTGLRLGETIVKCGFVSGPQLASALAAQYGIELTTEKGFGTGLRSEIQRRHESDRRRVVQLAPPLPEPATTEHAQEEPVEHEPAAAEATLLAQLEEQWAKLAAAEESLAERERELAELGRDHDARLHEVRRLEELNGRLREQIEELKLPARVLAATPAAPASHLVFVQLDGRYELVTREGPPPALSTPLSLPDVAEGVFVVAGSRRSPLPGDARPCVHVQRVAAG
ncbi:MAG: hypothetical protein ACRDNB_05940 [Gaiellaceae bacterium]